MTIEDKEKFVITNQQRQEHISDPKSIFRKLREKAAKDGATSQDPSHRHRQNLKAVVPKAHDEDIIKLCHRYKIKGADDDDDKVEQVVSQKMQTLKDETKQKYTLLISAIEKELALSKKQIR